MKYKFLLLLFSVLPLVISTHAGALNQYCRVVAECGRFGYMCSKNMTCQCALYYYADSRKEKCVGGVGQTCEYDEDCIEDAFCKNQLICECKGKLVASFNGTRIICGNKQDSNSQQALNSSSSILLPLFIYYYYLIII